MASCYHVIDFIEANMRARAGIIMCKMADEIISRNILFLAEMLFFV